MLTRRTSSKNLQWQRARRFPLSRQLEISTISFQFLLYLLWDRLTGDRTSRRRQRRARWLVRQLMFLGPTFIKIGQSLSTRADLIPIEYIQELTQLQDRVPEFDRGEAIAVIELELGKPIDILFQSFNHYPLACASLGQVHRATLHSGEEVVVKVQRPGLEELFLLDFQVLQQLTGLIHFLPDARKYNLSAIYQEFFGLLFQEIDYIHEGKNADRFRENFKGYPHVIAPQVYWQYTTKRVLTLEYLPGIKIDDRETLQASGINLDRIIQIGICSYLKQLLQDGFFQSDPHPGNMAVSLTGDIIFYDFGTMAEVKSVAKDQMIKTFFAVLKKDSDEVLETLIYMGLIEPQSDPKPVRRIITFLLDEFRDKPVDIKAFERISEEVYMMFQQQPFRLPPQMTFIIKSLTTLDGIARALDPKYNLIAASQPFIKSLAVSNGNRSLIITLAQQTKDFIQMRWNQARSNQKSLSRLTDRIEQGEVSFRVRSLESERILKRIYIALKSLIYACLTGFSILTAIALVSTAYSKLAIIPFGLAGLFGLFLIRSLIVLIIKERMDRIAEK